MPRKNVCTVDNRATAETQMLRQYLAQDGVGGRIYSEVQTGRYASQLWPDNSTNRRIDGVRVTQCTLIPNVNQAEVINYHACKDEFEKDIHECVPELIEVKGILNRSVIGQVLVAEKLFCVQYQVRTVDLVILCGGIPDPALKWVCEEAFGIKVVCFPSNNTATRSRRLRVG